MAASAKKPKRVAYTFWLSRADLAALRRLAARSGDPVSALLRRGARMLLDVERQKRGRP